jgi:hypothetical protein
VCRCRCAVGQNVGRTPKNDERADHKASGGIGLRISESMRKGARMRYFVISRVKQENGCLEILRLNARSLCNGKSSNGSGCGGCRDDAKAMKKPRELVWISVGTSGCLNRV